MEPPWLVPDAMRTRYFTGREDLLARLRQQLVERHRVALSGLGGIGKTQTAIEYAVRHRADYPDGVFWVNAETPSGLTGGFVEIAKTLRLSAAASSDQEQVARAVLEWLNGNDRWLLILDNVDDRRDVRSFVPQRGKGDVLITSRESVFQELGIARALDVRDLDNDEAVHFLLTRTGREGDERRRRARPRSNWPRSSGISRSHSSRPQPTLRKPTPPSPTISHAFRKRRVTLLEKSSGLVSHDTLAVTWAANFAAVEAISPAAADVLRTSAFLAPDAIPFEIFSKGAPSLGGAIATALSDPDELAMAEAVATSRSLFAHSIRRGVAHIRRASVGARNRAGGDWRIRTANLRRANGRGPQRSDFPRSNTRTGRSAIGSFRTSCRLPDGLTPTTCARQCRPILNQTGRYLTERGRYAEARTAARDAR